MKKQILNEEFKRMQKLAGIINEASTFISKVDWYLNTKNGEIMPDVEGDDLDQDEEFMLYIDKGTKGYVKDGNFISDEGSNVPFESEYFKEYSENQINEELNSPSKMLELVQMYVDNYFDEGMTASAALEKIDNILNGKLDGYDKAFLRGEEDEY
jgi:hypothetical protein